MSLLLTQEITVKKLCNGNSNYGLFELFLFFLSYVTHYSENLFCVFWVCQSVFFSQITLGCLFILFPFNADTVLDFANRLCSLYVLVWHLTISFHYMNHLEITVPVGWTLTHFVSQTRLSRLQRDVASAHKRETFVLDWYFHFCVPSVEVAAPS